MVYERFYYTRFHQYAFLWRIIKAALCLAFWGLGVILHSHDRTKDPPLLFMTDPLGGGVKLSTHKTQKNTPPPRFSPMQRPRLNMRMFMLWLVISPPKIIKLVAPGHNQGYLTKLCLIWYQHIFRVWLGGIFGNPNVGSVRVKCLMGKFCSSCHVCDRIFSKEGLHGMFNRVERFFSKK